MAASSGAALDVALIDEHHVVRASLEAWFAAEPGIRTVGSFPRPELLLAWLPTAPPVHAVIIEIQEDGHAPDMNSIRLLDSCVPSVVIYSRLTSDEIILAGLDAGARCYVTKDEDADHLIRAVRATGSGANYVAPHMAAALLRCDAHGRIALSEREKQVLTAWLKTDSKDDVARSLHLSPATVRTHLQRIRAKYAAAGRPAHTKAALLARAVDDGLVGLTDISGGENEP